jgi:hypothetical protein
MWSRSGAQMAKYCDDVYPVLQPSPYRRRQQGSKCGSTGKYFGGCSKKIRWIRYLQRVHTGSDFCHVDVQKNLTRRMMARTSLPHDAGCQLTRLADKKQRSSDIGSWVPGPGDESNWPTLLVLHGASGPSPRERMSQPQAPPMGHGDVRAGLLCAEASH